MGYEVFADLCKKNGVKPYHVSKCTGVSTATLTEWKKGTYTPKTDKLQKIADYFGVSLEYLTTGRHPEQTSDNGKKYYFSDDTAAAAQELFENENLRGLMSAARNCPPDVIKNVTNLLLAYKETNPDG